MLSIVVEIDAALCWAAPLVGVVAETLTRGRFNVRIERVGRPEVKNMMLAPKEFDPVNRDLEIRDLYNMEDAFHLGDTYLGAYRARLNANLAFWDGLDGKAGLARRTRTAATRSPSWSSPTSSSSTSPSRTSSTARSSRSSSPPGAAKRTQTCGGRTLNDDVIDTIFTQLVNAGNGPVDPRRGRPGHPARQAQLPLPGAAQPGPARASRAPLTMKALTDRDRDDGRQPWSSTTSRPGRCYERPSPYVGTYLLLRIHDRADGRELVRRLHRIVEPGRSRRRSARTPRSLSRSPTRA